MIVLKTPERKISFDILPVRHDVNMFVTYRKAKNNLKDNPMRLCFSLFIWKRNRE